MGEGWPPLGWPPLVTAAGRAARELPGVPVGETSEGRACLLAGSRNSIQGKIVLFHPDPIHKPRFSHFGSAVLKWHRHTGVHGRFGRFSVFP